MCALQFLLAERRCRTRALAKVTSPRIATPKMGEGRARKRGDAASMHAPQHSDEWAVLWCAIPTHLNDLSDH